MYLKPCPSCADQVLVRDLQVLEEELVGLVVDHVGDRPHRQAVADGVAQVDDEDRHAFALLHHVGQRRGARQQDHQVAVLDAADPHLLAVDHPAVAAVLTARGLDLGGVGAGAGLGDAHALQAQSRRGDGRQITLLLLGTAVAQQRAHVVHLAVAGAGIAAAAVDLFHDHAGLGQAQARAAIVLRDQRGQPAGLGQRVDELGLGVAARAIHGAKVLVGELRAQRCARHRGCPGIDRGQRRIHGRCLGKWPSMPQRRGAGSS